MLVYLATVEEWWKSGGKMVEERPFRAVFGYR